MGVMKRLTGFSIALWAAAMLMAWPLGAAAHSGGQVKVTPLGSHAGELCRNDRAILFEDPTGVRILYDPGRTVDATDDRLGDIHLILLSHAHSDHIGDARPNVAAPGTCAAPATVAATPNSTLAAIAAAKNAAVFVPGELSGFIARKIQNITSAAVAGCPDAGPNSETTLPRIAPCTAALRPGGSRTVRLGTAGAGVKVAVVPAVHSNGIPASLIDPPGLPPGLAGYGGSEGGFIITFTNDLTVYLTGDTGMFGDMRTIIRRFYSPSLVVINMSDTVTFGPDEAAFAISSLLMPATVVPSHTNEQSTSGGAVVPGTRVDRLIRQLPRKTAVVLPLSGVTYEFDQNGRCVGCR